MVEPALVGNLDRSQLASLSGQLAQQVLALIHSDALQSGDRLPSVKELSERFSVATPTMREALRLLQMAGNLDIRHGSGIYVRRPKSRLMLTNPYAGSLSTAHVLNILQARLLIEPPVAELAATNATPKQHRPPRANCWLRPRVTCPARMPPTPSSASSICASTAASPKADG